MQSLHNDEFQQVIDTPHANLANVEQPHWLECTTSAEQFSAGLLNEVDVNDRILCEPYTFNEDSGQHSSASDTDDDLVAALALLEPNRNHERYVDGQAAPSSHLTIPLYYKHEEYPNGSIEKYGENKWSEAYDHIESIDLPYYIRNQSRRKSSVLDISDNDISLGELFEICSKRQKDESYWFHGTRWEYAEQISQTGPRISTKKSDFAANGAFYLNPSYMDCYELFTTYDEKMDGFDAMLIYKFDPWTLSKHGEQLTYSEWKKVVNERSTDREVKCKLDWSFAFQNASPKKVQAKKHNPRSRVVNDNNGERAMQLVIYNNEMCSKIHTCLVGCVFYENVKRRVRQTKPLCPSKVVSLHQRPRYKK